MYFSIIVFLFDIVYNSLKFLCLITIKRSPLLELKKRKIICISFLKGKLKIEPYDQAILLLGIYSKEMKLAPRRDTCAPIFIATLFTVAKIWK